MIVSRVCILVHVLVCVCAVALTFLDAWRDGEQGDQEAEAGVGRQEDLIEQAGLRVGVVQGHEYYSTHSHSEQDQGDQGQRSIPQPVILHPRVPVGRWRRG